ncbi:MAG TPA: lyase family protein [Xanthobacteraceae bacterium]|nr:lyase family protein [Xanthobacteraceae bacterium]
MAGTGSTAQEQAAKEKAAPEKVAPGNVTQGRLAGAKAQSYLRAVNELEARASGFTARLMLITDLAYLICSAEMQLMPPDTARHLAAAVLEIINHLSERDLSKPPGDIVAQRERWIADRVSKTDAAWLHLGRNRGESLRNYLPRLFFRQVLHAQGKELANLVRRIVDRAGPLLSALAPNYHHLQHSGLATAGEYLLSWAVTFERHIQRLQQIDQRLDYGPSTFGGRQQTNQLFDAVSKRLGFSRRARLRRDGIWVQDQFSEPFFALALIAVDLARLAQDLRIWVTPEFSLFDLADEHAGGSSALPHAKVPFGLQAVIGAGVMAATRLGGEMAASCAGPSEGSEPIYSSGTLYQTALDVVANTRFMAEVVDKGTFDTEEMKRKALLDYAGTSEAHDRLVYDFGVPFRTGHRILGAMVRAHFYKEPLPDLRELLRAETGRDFDVDQKEIMDIVLGRIIWPTTIDEEGLRKVWAELDQKAGAATAAFADEGTVNRALDRLVSDAKSFCSQQ